MNLLKLQKALSYKIDEGGMCYGIAFMGIQAIIRNKVDSYIYRINLINNYIDKYGCEDKAIEALIFDINTAYNKRTNKLTRETLTDNDNRLLSILDWLDGIQIYHGLDLKSIGKSHYHIEYQDYERSTNFFGGNDERYQKIFLQSKDVCLLTRAKISEIYHKVLYSNKSIAFSITRPGHIIAIGKSKSFNSIYLINHNQHSIISNADQAFNLIYRACFDGVVSEDKAVCILEFTDISSLSNLKAPFDKTTNNFTDRNIQDLLYIALSEGHHEAVKEYTEHILRTKKYYLLTNKNKVNTNGLYLALQNGHTETVKKYIEIIAQSNMTIIDKKKFILAEKNGFPSLHIVLHNGHIETIKTYIEAIININSFSIDNKYELISGCSGTNSTPVLFMALSNGHANGVKAYIDGITNINIPINYKYQLIQAKSDEFPGLYMALDNGHAEAVKAYIDGIANMNIPIDYKYQLIQAKTNDVPGLYMALDNGHAEAVKAYIDGIANMNIPIDYKYQLIQAKTNDVPGLYMALDNGHAEAVKIYIQTVSKINSFSYIDKAKLFVAKSDFGTPGLQGPLFNVSQDKKETIANYLKEIKEDSISIECAKIIMNNYNRAKQIKDMLLAWAQKYKSTEIKNRTDYPLLMKLLSYNRSSTFKKETTASMKQFMRCNGWK
ncbi:ankyrin repeat domain-containing protein [Francisella sp. LA112445]|uniref:ankyrin repeat domain-containing protein n=1 Tax=Francisella sp. LA112445 TaxID=1395624 RepID=UPI001788BCC4|nr:ankyrin repeat domain-containing protein [Francisella sp. LA112445]QIW09717.1 ankyrin repeat domain-containing protein [Francisella sp. LA112445]